MHNSSRLPPILLLLNHWQPGKEKYNMQKCKMQNTKIQNAKYKNAQLPSCNCSITASQVMQITRKYRNIKMQNSNIQFTNYDNDHQSLWSFSHVMENLENIESHANHRPGYYKDNISPLIHGLFSRWGLTRCERNMKQFRFQRSSRRSRQSAFGLDFAHCPVHE